MSNGSASRAKRRWRAETERWAREFRRRVGRLRAATREVKRAHLLRHWEGLPRLMLALGACSTGNTVKLYDDGDECFEAQWRAIGEAKRRVWMEMYTLEPDGVGKRTIEELRKAAERGCNVILMVDAIGSSNLRWSHVGELRKAGGEVLVFNRLFPWFKWAKLWQRDHRKVLVVDGRVAFTGGMNISEAYAGKRYGQGDFDDCHMRLEGPGARDLAGVFLRTYKRLSGKRKRTGGAGRMTQAGTFVQVLRSDGLVLARRSAQRAMRYAVKHARSTCYITNPYLVPPARLVHALKGAVKRGVDVRIMTSGACDVRIVWRAANHIYGVLLNAGIRVYELTDCKLHAKTMTVDGVYATVGTMNLDQWSDKRNLEVNVAMVDEELAKELEAKFRARVDRSREVTLGTWGERGWWQRMVQWWSYQLMRV